MKVKLIRNRLLVIGLLFLIIATPVIAAGCQEEVEQPAATFVHGELSTTLVPNVNLDMYVYVKQDSPTTVPRELFGVESDLVAVSLALWGIPIEETLILGGELTFASAADATKLHSQIPAQAELWTKLSVQTIYFVYGSGTVAESLKTAISKKDFKSYDDQKALQEVALLPDGRTTILAAIGIVIPSEPLAKLIAKYADPKYSNMIQTLLKLAKLQVITAGLYAPQQIDAAELARKIEYGDFWESDLGILASIKSGLPGSVVSTVVQNILSNTEYDKKTVGELTLYRSSFETSNDKVIPVLISIEGNRIYVAVSGQESYAQTLITNVSR